MALKQYLIILFLLIPCLIKGQDIIRQNLGPKINTKYPESKPIISPDGKTLFFVRQNYPDNIKGIKDPQDIYYSLLTDEEWSVAVNIGEPLNDKHPNGVSAVSADGKRLLVINAYSPDGSIESGASICEKTNNMWGYPEKIYIQDFYNLSSYVDYFISHDEKLMLLAVETDDSEGDQDLYVSFKVEDKNWSRPVNLGPHINTELAEFSPFLATDNKTLFFASMGHNGYGSSDIYYSKRLDETWQNWSKPVNLGPEVNSREFEAYYTIPAKGEFAYYISTNHSIDGSKDIFRVTIPYKFRPEPVLLVSGTVYDKSTKAPVEADISFKNFATGKMEGSTESNAENGDYRMILPRGTMYSYLATKTGYMGVTQYKDLQNISEYQEFESDFALVPIKEGQEIAIHDITFEENTAIFLSEAFSELNRFAAMLVQHPGLQIEISGHASTLKSATDNLHLSTARADSVKAYFINKGIHPTRLITKGYGPMEPFKNTDRISLRPGVNVNDRIEIKILSATWTIPTDKDEDGITDKEDACPDTAGPSSTNGCPDDDGDGIINSSDDCPMTAGIKENKGCPEVTEEVKIVLQEALEGIEFELGKDVITTGSFQVLNKVVEVMKANPEYKLKISGHTDDQGNDESNLVLSHKRAQATKHYLAANGIDGSRLDAVGYGETKPVADNSTATGRAKNRRVEFEIIFQ